MSDERRALRLGDRIAEISDDELELILNGLGVLRDDYTTSKAEEEPFRALAARLESELR